MENRTVIQWDKDDLDVLKLLKVDILALGHARVRAAARAAVLFVDAKMRQLMPGPAAAGVVARGGHRRALCRRPPRRGGSPSAKRQEQQGAPAAHQDRASGRRRGATRILQGSNAFSSAGAAAAIDIVADRRGWTASTTSSRRNPEEGRLDPVYDMLSTGDSVGVFQVESRAQMSMLPRLRPREFYDLVVEVAIVRPGPIQGGMVHPYLKRRQSERSRSPTRATRSRRRSSARWACRSSRSR